MSIHSEFCGKISVPFFNPNKIVGFLQFAVYRKEIFICTKIKENSVWGFSKMYFFDS
jgi:hypothetical protein